MDLLVIGLGNPGLSYQNNRHNVGFKVVELLAERLNVSLKKVLFKPLLSGEVKFQNYRIVLVKPLTYMNSSGNIIPYLFRKYKMNEKNLLVLCDNMDLNPGRCKLKLKGSPAAHNGLKSITGVIDSNNFMRIFIGIGHPGSREAVVQHVLGNPEEHEIPSYVESYKNCSDAVLKIAEDLHGQVMNELNRKETAI